MIESGRTVAFETEDGAVLRLSLTIFLLDVRESRTFADLRDRFRHAAWREMIEGAMAQSDGNIAAAARSLGISRATLVYRMQQVRWKGAA